MKQLKITKFPALDYAGNEAFNTLTTNLSFAGASVKKIMITSCHAAEGKSYLAMNLMRTLAQRGIKVALVALLWKGLQARCRVGGGHQCGDAVGGSCVQHRPHLFFRAGTIVHSIDHMRMQI